MKPFISVAETVLGKSPPARGRGLKPITWTGWRGSFVAPRAGAWIETTFDAEAALDLLVAPRAGAWIETRYQT